MSIFTRLLLISSLTLAHVGQAAQSPNADLPEDTCQQQSGLLPWAWVMTPLQQFGLGALAGGVSLLLDCLQDLSRSQPHQSRMSFSWNSLGKILSKAWPQLRKVADVIIVVTSVFSFVAFNMHQLFIGSDHGLGDPLFILVMNGIVTYIYLLTKASLSDLLAIWPYSVLGSVIWLKSGFSGLLGFLSTVLPISQAMSGYH